MDNARRNDHQSPSSDLVSDLNALLRVLYLPLTLESPDDLIPSLLVAIIECLLRTRLDIPTALRQARDFASKVQAMKIFLGVLENDIIGQDVGLSDVDPRRLARGEWDECVFVGELLCWLGRTMGVLPSTSKSDVHPLPVRFARRSGTMSSSTHSTVPSNLSLTHSLSAESETTMESIVFEPAGESTFVRPPAPTPLASRRDTVPRRPRCIHEVEEPSLIFTPAAESSVVADCESDVEYCDCPSEVHARPSAESRSRSTPVRYDGYIEPADEDSEVRFFKASHSARSASVPRRVADGSRNFGFITRHTSPTEYTVALMNERARLLAELAALKTPPKKG